MGSPRHKNSLSVTAHHTYTYHPPQCIAHRCCHSVVAPTRKKSILNGKQFFHNKTISFSVISSDSNLC